MNTIYCGYNKLQSVTNSISEFCDTLCRSTKQYIDFLLHILL